MTTNDVEHISEQEPYKTPAPKSKSKTGRFFCVDDRQLIKALDLGFNETAVYLLVCNGTQKDNITSSWGASACEKYFNLTNKMALKLIGRLCSAKLLKKTSNKRFPYSVIHTKTGNPIYLPNALVTGVGSEDKPLMRLRPYSDAATILRILLFLYAAQDTASEFGVPPDILFRWNTVTRAGATGVIVAWFMDKDKISIYRGGQLAKKMKIADMEPDKIWSSLYTIESEGLATWTKVIKESNEPDALPYLVLPKFTEKTKDKFFKVLKFNMDVSTKLAQNGHEWQSGRQIEYERVVALPSRIKNPFAYDVIRLRYGALTSRELKGYGLTMSLLDTHMKFIDRMYSDYLNIKQF